MSREKLSDTATEADWAFLEYPEIHDSLRHRAEVVAKEWGADADDLFQETCLWLAVRFVTERYDLDAEEDVALFLHWAHLKFTDQAASMTRNAWRLSPLSEYGRGD